ncbi:unnamed protein product [Rotaria sp. Silwood1]|nr:unnamed protein product [Rotaria sp. Silwood1]CAF3799990.1 unnamed protein product [Rotaria sp. Silwood1]CAF4574388.1 unnamed protein product [Rotaria sp. Silwood1]CAF4752810.1 unnamed protein product [Rotaria sp. Silwood1]
MYRKRIFDRSDKYVQTIRYELPKHKAWHGFNHFTLKNGLEMLFALLIPAAIAILAISVQKNDMDMNRKNRENDLYISQLQRDSDEQQARYLANETIVSNYIKNMGDIILYSLVKFDGQQYTVTRALTSTILRQLDLNRKRLVIQFLYDATILRRYTSIFDTHTTNENEKNLEDVILDQVNFSGGLNLSTIVLRSVSLVNATFSNSNLDASDFSNSILTGVNFSNTKLSRVKFNNVELQNVDFTGASVENMQLIRANLSQSTITNEQISQALFVYNTILPNGTYARNKTFINNGDTKQGLNQWNITSGIIEVKDSYFMGKSNSTMFQRINTTDARLYSSYESFDYCLSFLFHGQENIMIQIIELNQKRAIIGVNNIGKSKLIAVFNIIKLAI